MNSEAMEPKTDEQVETAGEVPPAEAAASASKAKKAAPRTRKSKKSKRQVPTGRAYIQATYNNTLVTLTDPDGNVLAWSSAGNTGFRGPKKSTPYAASVVVRRAAERAAEYGLKDVYVFVRGVGQGREGAIRALNANGLNILSIKDVTPIPHNGCRSPRPRRV